MDNTVYLEIVEGLRNEDMSIVFPEGEDRRIIGAAARLYNDDLITPILLGKEEEIRNNAKEFGVDLTDIRIIDPEKADDFDEMV